MEVRFSRLKSSRPFTSISNLIRERTTLRYQDITIILDLIIFFLKKTLIENKEVKIISFGKLYIIKFSKSGNIIRFKSSRALKWFINGQKEDFELKSNKYNKSPNLNYIVMSVSKCLRIKKKDSIFIFRLFIYGIVQGLLKDRMLKIRGFGIFYIQDRGFSNYNICNKATEVKNTLRIKFKNNVRLLRDINGKEKNIETFSRTKKILKINGFDDKI